MALKLIGRISGTKGYQGSLVIKDFPAGIMKIARGNKLNIGFSEQFSRQYTIKLWQETEKGPLIQLKEVTNEKEAEALKEQGVFAEESLLKFKKDESYYIEQIIGCEVFDQKSGELLGKIVDVWLLPGNDVWVMVAGDKEIPLPVIDDVIKDVDIKKKRVEVEMIEGLEEL